MDESYCPLLPVALVPNGHEIISLTGKASQERRERTSPPRRTSKPGAPQTAARKVGHCRRAPASLGELRPRLLEFLLPTCCTPGTAGACCETLPECCSCRFMQHIVCPPTSWQGTSKDNTCTRADSQNIDVRLTDEHGGRQERLRAAISLMRTLLRSRRHLLDLRRPCRVTKA